MENCVLEDFRSSEMNKWSLRISTTVIFQKIWFFKIRRYCSKCVIFFLLLHLLSSLSLLAFEMLKLVLKKIENISRNDSLLATFQGVKKLLIFFHWKIIQIPYKHFELKISLVNFWFGQFWFFEN